ncbi:hypothetical protein MHYP_G00068460 [Metynnis hypsauchen]
MVIVRRSLALLSASGWDVGGLRGGVLSCCSDNILDIRGWRCPWLLEKGRFRRAWIQQEDLKIENCYGNPYLYGHVLGLMSNGGDLTRGTDEVMQQRLDR